MNTQIFTENAQAVAHLAQYFGDRKVVALRRDLRREPGAFGLTGHLWDGKMLCEHLRQRYGVALGVRQCQRIFTQMGFRLRKPRPQVAQSDPMKVAAVKNIASLGKAA